MPTSEKPVILDTHVWAMLALDDPAVARTHVARIVEAAAADRRLYVSAISVWEIAMLEAKGRIQLHPNVTVWVRDALDRPRISLVPLSPEIAIESTRLPGGELLHTDPSDRIIAASARLLDGMLLTRDRGLLDYAERGYIKALKI